ncbi:hypothetical protein U1Q18_013115 [Sarracenia purpurea var. burkii]
MVDQLKKPSHLHYSPDFGDDLFSSDLIFSDAGEIYDRDPKLVFGLRRCISGATRQMDEDLGGRRQRQRRQGL